MENFLDYAEVFTDITENNYSHAFESHIDLAKEKERLKNTPNLALPLEEELEILENIVKFELGQSVMENKGLSGKWISYIILHAPKMVLENPVEDWIVNKAPIACATRERFYIFQEETKNLLEDNMKIASLPCGLMEDLLLLDYSNYNNIELNGIDLDNQSLYLAIDKAKELNPGINAKFMQKDAWNLEIKEEYDLMLSNGLNIYVHDEAKVTELYKNIYDALKTDGHLITSFVTPPPVLSSESSWKNYTLEEITKQKAIFADVLQVKWQAFTTESKFREIMEDIGFTVEKIIYDARGMFPTVIVKK